MSTATRQRIRTGVLAAVAVVVACAALDGCAGPRNTLNTATSQCFRALPLARASANDRGRLVGVRSVHATTLARRLPEAAPLGRQRLCVFAFKGPYNNGEITRARPAGPGTYAVIAVDRSGSTVLASFVVNDLPLRFRHL